MSQTFKPMGAALAAVVAAIPQPATLLQGADAAMAARDAEADALAAGAAQFEAAEPFAPLPREPVQLGFDL